MPAARLAPLDRRDPATQPEGIVAGYAQSASRWPAEPLVRRRRRAPSSPARRTCAGALAPVRGDLAGHGAKRALGQLILLRARVLDEDGAPVPAPWSRSGTATPPAVPPIRTTRTMRRPIRTSTLSLSSRSRRFSTALRCEVVTLWFGFLIFSDYGRGAIRSDALMEFPLVHVFTHDSIGRREE